MRIEFLGGSSEVGASCTLYQSDGTNILIDAGIRMGSEAATGLPGDALPDLARISDVGHLDAILVTHAHMDHIGALPLVHQAFPRTPIYATAPTVELMQVLLADALRIMAVKAEQEAEIPLYDPATVGSMFARIQPVHFGQGTIELPSRTKLSFHPAGHILGAALVEIQGQESNLLVSGDFSVTDQRTVAGMVLPRTKPDVLITESTYGNRLHSNRAAEERRLIEAIAATIGRGGSVLIPAFALGRSQEVLLCLDHYQAQGLLPKVPIWVDGLVRSICRVYASFPEYLMPHLRKRVEQDGTSLFWRKANIQPVARGADREKILKRGPCIIVSSSGMLAGGPSQYYAFHMASDPRNAILLTGYQDEESPGRKILELAEKGGGYFSYEGKSVEVICEIAKYGLSAHADAAEIAAFTRALAPQIAVLVHGEYEARESLSTRLGDLDTRQPANGEALDWSAGGMIPAQNLPSSVLAKADLGEFSPEKASDILPAIWQKVASEAKGRISSKVFTPAELALIWQGQEASEELIAALSVVLDQRNPYFAPDWKRPYLYRARSAAVVKQEKQRQELMARLGEILPGKLILVKDEDAVVPALCFAVEEYSLEALKVGTADTTHLPESLVGIIGQWDTALPWDHGREKARLHLLTRQVIPLKRLFSLEKMLRLLLTRVDGEWPGEIVLADEASHLGGVDSQENASAAFSSELLALAWSVAEYPEIFELDLGAEGEVVCRLRDRDLAQEMLEGELELAQAAGEKLDGGPLEMNQALASADRLLPPSTGLYRKGADVATHTLLLYFNFPEVAKERFQEPISELARITGWQVQLNDNPNQEALRRLALEVLPPEARVQKGPSIRLQERTVELRLVVPEEKRAWAFAMPEYREALDRFAAETGMSLILNLGEGVVISSTQTNEDITRSTSTVEHAKPDPLPQRLAGDEMYMPKNQDFAEPSEINAAYSYIRERFAELGVEITKVGKKHHGPTGRDYIEVSFLSPVIGHSYGAELQDLANGLGWPLAISPNPNQHAIADYLQRLIPRDWEPAPSASFYPKTGTWAIKVARLPEDNAEVDVLQQEFKDYCGYKLEFK
ncbi:MAG: MBL fold metallo-hydrolase [Firmicutes bacterium]|nr:MBL fold metallo-hydrolase [Bacillota bacterium]